LKGGLWYSSSKHPLRCLRIRNVLVEMLEIHIFGSLKKIFFPEGNLSDDSAIKLPFVENETFEDLLKRLQISRSHYGEIFVNHKIVKDLKKRIPDEARVGIFSQGMFLIDGGLYLKKWKES
jgi:hypothetical protein